MMTAIQAALQSFVGLIAGEITSLREIIFFKGSSLFSASMISKASLIEISLIKNFDLVSNSGNDVQHRLLFDSVLMEAARVSFLLTFSVLCVSSLKFQQ